MTDIVFWVSGDIWKYVCLSKEGIKIKKIEKAKAIKGVPSQEEIKKSIHNLQEKLKQKMGQLKDLFEKKGFRQERKEKEEEIINLRNKLRLLEEYLRIIKNPII